MSMKKRLLFAFVLIVLLMNVPSAVATASSSTDDRLISSMDNIEELHFPNPEWTENQRAVRIALLLIILGLAAFGAFCIGFLIWIAKF